MRRLLSSLRAVSTVVPEVIIYVDDDDLSSHGLAKEQGIKCCRGPRHLLSRCYNEAAALATNDIIMYAGDDLVFRTQDWDGMVVRQFEKSRDKIICVHGDDQSHGGTLHATHGILHRRWINTVGYFVPPYFAGWFDNWITDMANALNRRICLPFINEHMHYTHGKATMDDTYKEAVPSQASDTQKFKELAPKRKADVQKLAKKLDTPISSDEIEKKMSLPVSVEPSYDGPTCPSCKSSLLQPTQGRVRCGQCGLMW